MPFIATHNTGDYLARPYQNPANFLMNSKQVKLKQYRHEGGKRKVKAGIYNPQTEGATLLATTSTTPSPI